MEDRLREIIRLVGELANSLPNGRDKRLIVQAYGCLRAAAKLWLMKV